MFLRSPNQLNQEILQNMTKQKTLIYLIFSCTKSSHNDYNMNKLKIFLFDVENKKTYEIISKSWFGQAYL